MKDRSYVSIAVVILSLAALWLYRGILFAPGSAEMVPWASDTLGHVMKVAYLREQVEQGVLYPNLFPGWYMGVQMFRYYPPLPYYLLLLLSWVAPNAIAASGWMVALCALAGGLAWLPYRRWLGQAPALLGGLLYLFLPDNVRVALAEGNLPRVLATAILPLAFYFLLRTITEQTGDEPLPGRSPPDGATARSTGWGSTLALVLCFTAIVLSHAMMAAIYAACCALFVVICWLIRVISLRQAVNAILTMALGVLLAGAWLLPSLTGGITEIDSSAMTEALAVFPLSAYLNPLARAANPEAPYPGAALLVLSAAGLFVRARAPGKGLPLLLTGLLGVLIGTPGFNQLFNALPFHNLFWPLRFLGLASFLLLLGLVFRWKESGALHPLVLLGVVALIAWDGLLSLPLIHLRPPRADVLRGAQELQARPGWREATLDFSRMGSAPTYYFSSLGGREQVFGWAYQGARTARNVANLNEALAGRFYAYLIDRLDLLGVDDVFFFKEQAADAELIDRLRSYGFTEPFSGSEATLLHRDGSPRAVLPEWKALGIGAGAYNVSFLFPQMIVGSSPVLDDYTLEELTAFDTVFLSGFRWDNREKAEALARAAAQAGVHVVVDLTGVPNDPLAREPVFLGVWGETVLIDANTLRIEGQAGQQPYVLSPIEGYTNWQTFTPQGLETETLWFQYVDASSAVLGYQRYEGGKVWFVGLNLPYRAVLTHDPAILNILSGLLQLPAETPDRYATLALEEYSATQAGYAFTYQMDTGHLVLVPVAFHEGTEVRVDGAVVGAQSFENLVGFPAPAGRHRVTITFKPVTIHFLGMGVSGLAVLGVLAGLARRFGWKRGQQDA